MRALMSVVAAAMLIGASHPAKLLTPSDIVSAAPASAWNTIPADELLVIDLAGGRRVIVQLAPQFAPVHVGNIRAMARGGYWRGSSIYRVQDNYVAQWGQNDSKAPWLPGVLPKPPAEYTRPLKGLSIKPLGSPDAYAPAAGFSAGWPIAFSVRGGWADLVHCYGSVGVGRNLSPDTGTGGELYAVIGQAPRQLDRNIALVGRVVDGMENFSSLPRGTDALGFYKEKSQFISIADAKLASNMPAPKRPSFEVMDTGSMSFARYLQVRANRHDDFYIRPAGGVDVCNVQVPVRKKGA